ncbi:MAG: hypothetical protein EPN94_02265 [Nitrospirae bacterium]|nr:MAG: hypothetical protein EPN94_02265 [Nitrospirota bacterium]
MHENIKLLIELQGVDSVIIRDKNIIASMPSKLLSADQAFKEIQARYDAEKQKLNLLEKKKKDKEKETEEINDRIKKIKARASEIKTNKEYQAHLKEIEAIEKERYAIEDEILAVMEALDAAGKELKSEESKVKAEKDKLEAFKKEVENEIAGAEKELSEKKARRADIAGKVNPDMYNEYMKVLKACGGLAVVEAKDEICQGCNMNIPPQMFVEIKKNEEINQCPQCRRILYWKEVNE